MSGGRRFSAQKKSHELWFYPGGLAIVRKTKIKPSVVLATLRMLGAIHRSKYTPNLKPELAAA